MPYDNNEERFTELIRVHRPGLIRLARKLCGTGGVDPEDLVQEVIERALYHGDRLWSGSESSRRAWLGTTLLNLFRDRYRRRRVEQSGLAHWGEVQEQCVDPDGPPPERWERVTPRDLQEAIGELKPNLREAYVLFARGLRYKQIAEQLEIPVGTVGSWLFHARLELKEKLLRKVEQREQRLAAHPLGADPSPADELR